MEQAPRENEFFSEDEFSESRISGGDAAKPNEFPWMAHISLPSDKSCGGVLISCNHVLTAAHCIEPFDKSSLLKNGEITLGSVSPSKGRSFSIREAIIHPDFDPDGFNSESKESIHNDLAILVLDESTRIKPAPLGSRPPPPGAKGMLLGWGETESSSSSPRLLKTTVSILENKACDGKIPKQYFDADSSVCAGPDLDRPVASGTYTSACSGDSGGPLIDPKSKRVLGIISYSFGFSSGSTCGDKRQTVLASISDGLKMIVDTVKDTLDGSCRMPIKPDSSDNDGPNKPQNKNPGKKPHNTGNNKKSYK